MDTNSNLEMGRKNRPSPRLQPAVAVPPPAGELIRRFGETATPSRFIPTPAAGVQQRGRGKSPSSAGLAQALKMGKSLCNEIRKCFYEFS
jgi:hypothetical protein